MAGELTKRVAVAAVGGTTGVVSIVVGGAITGATIAQIAEGQKQTKKMAKQQEEASFNQAIVMNSDSFSSAPSAIQV